MPTGGYFFLEPEAERFVRGETDRLPINGCNMLFLIPFVLSGLLILGLSVAQWVCISYFSSSKWAYTEGTDVSKDVVAESAGDTRFYVTFRFVVDDRVYAVEESVPQGIHDRATEGAVLRAYSFLILAAVEETASSLLRLADENRPRATPHNSFDAIETVLPRSISVS